MPHCEKSSKFLKDKVWFDSDLRRESRKRDRLRQIFFRTKTETAKKKFKTQRNKFNNLKKQAKQRFYGYQ